MTFLRFFINGRSSKLVVTQDELCELYKHIKTLPFHKLIEQNFVREYEINPEKLLIQNLALVKNVDMKKMI